jgi:plasmid stability protein
MPDLLIRNIDPHLKRQLQESARSHRRSLSEEARILLKKALVARPDKRKMGNALLELVPQEHRGDDLTFQIPGSVSQPPEFE